MSVKVQCGRSRAFREARRGLAGDQPDAENWAFAVPKRVSIITVRARRLALVPPSERSHATRLLGLPDPLLRKTSFEPWK